MTTNGINVLIEGVTIRKGTSSKTGNDFFTFEVIEPVTKFVGYSNNSQKGQLEDIAQTGQPVDLKLVLKGDRLHFISAEPSV